MGQHVCGSLFGCSIQDRGKQMSAERVQRIRLFSLWLPWRRPRGPSADFGGLKLRWDMRQSSKERRRDHGVGFRDTRRAGEKTQPRSGGCVREINGQMSRKPVFLAFIFNNNTIYGLNSENVAE